MVCHRADSRSIDISTVGLTDLRRRISYVPQDPVILSGTLRSALDVFDEYEDAELFEALRRVHLLPSADTPRDIDGVNSSPFWDLESRVDAEGSNFSQVRRCTLHLAVMLAETRVASSAASRDLS